MKRGKISCKIVSYTMSVTFLMLCLLLFSRIEAQTSCDSLQKRLSESKSQDESRFTILINTVKFCNEIKFSNASALLTEAVEISKAIKNPEKECLALCSLAELYEKNGNLSSASSFAKKAIEVADRNEKDVSGKIKSKKIFSQIIFEQGDISKAGFLLEDALTSAVKNNLTLLESECRLQMGNFYISIGKFRVAAAVYKKGLEVLVDKDLKLKSIFYSNLGTLYVNMGSFDSGAFFFNKAVKIKKTIKDEKGEFLILVQLAMIASGKKNPQEAIKLLESSKIIAQKLNDPILLGSTYKGLAAVFRQTGNKVSAAQHMEEAIKYFRLAQEKNELLDLYMAASEINAELGDNQKSNYYKNEFIALKDSINKFLSASSKPVSSSKKSEEKLNAKESDSNYYLFGGLLFLMMMLLLFTILRRRKQKS
jgi:tetratricopeptide (TPR) repeat protein